jgi:hypothetical protein
MVNVTEYQKGFLNEMVACGLKEGSESYRQLAFNTQTEEDVHVFLKDFWTGNKIIRAVERFRRFKRQQVQVTLEEFVALARQNKRQALEVVFQEPVTDSKMELVKDIDLDHLYILSMRNNTYTMTSILKNLEIVNGKEKQYKNDTKFLFV